jgi:DNA repair photolyase
MSSLPFISPAERGLLKPILSDPVEYRKSGLSLNHVIGCPLDCAYCVRHLFDNFGMKQPRLLMPDADAVNYLVQHRFFVPDVTPIQVFNKATDPFLPSVKQHTFAVLQDLDRRGLRNHVLVITRFHVTEEDCACLNEIRNIRLTLLVTYSGIDDAQIEPVESKIAAASLKRAYSAAKNYRTILYWRPIVPGLNDSEEHFQTAADLSHHAHATVFTGLFYRNEIRDFFKHAGVPDVYTQVARRKILPRELDLRIVDAFGRLRGRPLFRKTSCAVAYAHSTHDYNGHFGIRELCDICPSAQIERCRRAWKKPDLNVVLGLARRHGAQGIPSIDNRAIYIEGLDEQRRYSMQHFLGYQVHDVKYPHEVQWHGRATLGLDAAARVSH